MANNIKGITVEIGGDTGPLQNALKDVNKTSKDLQSELREVNRQLKLDPTNTTLLNQKQELLAKSIANTKEKLETLKNAEGQVEQQFKDGQVGEEKYRALQREVIKTEQDLKGLESQAIKSDAVLTKDEAVGNLKNIAKTAAAVATAAGAAFVAMGAAAVKNADELQRQSDVTGMSAETLQEFDYIGKNLGVDLDTITGAQSKLIKSMSSAYQGGKSQAAAFKELNVDIKDMHGGLRDSQEVMGDVFDALQKVENPTQRDALAMEIFGKSARDLNPLITAGSSEINKLSDEAKKNGAVMSNEAVAGLDSFGDTLDSIKASVMGSFGEAFAKILPNIQGLLNSLTQLPQWIQQNSTLLTILGVVLGTIIALIIAFNIQQALMASGMTLWSAIAAGATTVTTALGTAFAFLTSPIALVIIAIGAVIAIGVLLWKNWDTVKAKAQELGAYLGAAFNSIRTTIINIWNSIINWFKALPGTLYNIAVNMFNRMESGVASTVGGVKSSIVNGISSATNWIKSLPEQALQWGKDMIQGFTNGIKAKINGVVDSVKGLGDKIRSYLHFSTPDEGPLKDYESWMPDFMSGLADSIEKSKYKVQNEVQGLSSDMAKIIPSSFSTTQRTDSAANAPSDKAGAAGSTIINFNGNYSFSGKDDIDYFMNKAAQLVQRRKG